MNRLYSVVLVILMLVLTAFCPCRMYGQKVSLTLIPPTTITNQVNLDIRAGIVNNEDKEQQVEIFLYLNNKQAENLLHHSQVTLPARQSHVAKKIISTKNKIGNNKVILVVKTANDQLETTKEIEIIESSIRSTQTIDGTWAGFYHWSETEGKYWNPGLKNMSESDWTEIVRSMHKLE